MAIDITSISTGPSADQTTGPLAALDQKSPGLTPLVYPADLGSSTKNHYVKFSIKKVNPSTPVSSTNPDSTESKGVIDRLLSLNFQTPVQDAVGVICLYMPDSLTASYNASYDELSITNDLGKGIQGLQAIQSFAGKDNASKNSASASASDPAAIYAGASSFNKFLSNIKVGKTSIDLSGSGVTDIALNSQGFAINPQLQVIYRGLGFRKFQLNFVFTPASQAEATMVNQIIGTFKYHFAPDLLLAGNAVSGMFFIPPSFFNIEFMFNNNENQFLPRYGDCVLTDIDVNYAPNGFAAHNDGAPVQTQLSLSFQEIEIVTKAKIAAGYGATVGSPTVTTSPNSVAGLR